MGSVFQNLESLNAKLAAFREEAARNANATIVVGFTAAYALAVHENVAMKGAGLPRRSGIGVYWGPHGSAKFLEGPAREMGDELRAIVLKLVAAGHALWQALLVAGLRLQREAQKRVPVEYGLLKNSAFTRRES